MNRIPPAVASDEVAAPVRRVGIARPLRAVPLRSLGYPAFKQLLAAQVMFGFANWMNRLAIGFLVLDETESVFLTALSFAGYTAPGVIVAPIAGTISDRVDRRYLLAASSLAKAGVLVALAFIVLDGIGAIWPVILVSMATGVLTSIEMPSGHALVTDIVKKGDMMNAIAFQSVAMRAVGLLGALTGGILIDTVGGAPIFFTGAGIFGVAVLIVLSLPKPAPREREDGELVRSVFGDVIDGLRVMGGLPAVRTLLALAVLVEILAFSHMSVMPSVAKDVLEVGGFGLGVLIAMTGVGGLFGSILLLGLSDIRRRGLLILAVALAYGVGILLLSGSTWFAVSLVIVVGVGVTAAMFDALQWTLLQMSVPDRMRGRAVGGWVFAIGFGWIGQLELGAVGEAIGVQWALAINGSLVIVVVLAATYFVPLLRRA